jgi:hypothetical protein
MSYKTLIPLILFFFLAADGFGQENAAPINHLNTRDTLNFDSVKYKFAWSSHPNDYYYKQEYLLTSETFEHISKMVLVEFLKGDFTAKELVRDKILVLRKRQPTDKFFKYEVTNNADGTEYVLDFVVTGEENGTINVVEWDCYRYKAYTDKNGNAGVTLFGISHRAFNEDCKPFLAALPDHRREFITKVVDYPLPDIGVK